MNAKRLTFFVFIFLSSFFWSGGEARANVFDMTTCAAGDDGEFIPEWMITTRIVKCIEKTVAKAASRMMDMLTIIMKPTAAVLFLLAVIFFGVRILAGEQELTQQTVLFLIRFGVVVAFSSNMYIFAYAPMDVTKEAIAIVCGGPPWTQIDMALGRLLGFGPGLALFQGMMGVLGAALFSSSTGFTLFMIGFTVIMMVLNLAFRALYTYLVAIILMWFLVILSSIIVPLAIMRILERYVKKWLDLLIASMLSPFLLCAFLWLFFGLVNTAIGEIFALLGGNNFRSMWKNNTPFFSWILMSDPTLMQQFEAQGMQRGVAAQQGFMNPLLARGMESNLMFFPGMDFGPNMMMTLQALVIAFVSLGLVCFLMAKMVEGIPQLADSLAGTSTGIRFERIPFVDDIKQAIQKIANKSGGGGG